MKNVVLVISNKLNNNKLIAEDLLDKTLNDATITLEDKIKKTEDLLREVAMADISMNLWRSYITPPEDQENEEISQVEPDVNPKA